jgi:hypothetical protein
MGEYGFTLREREKKRKMILLNSWCEILQGFVAFGFRFGF